MYETREVRQSAHSTLAIVVWILVSTHWSLAGVTGFVRCDDFSWSDLKKEIGVLMDSFTVSMSREWYLLVFLLIGAAVDLVHGQLPYSSNPPAYDIPPLGVIHEYQRQLEDDIYAVERRAEAFGHRECAAGQESFIFCPLVLNIFDFTSCIINPATAQGADALTRGIKLPSGAFSSTPSVAVGISGIGTGPTCDVKVEAKDVHASGFNLVITGGFLFYPFSLDVIWIACPVKQQLNTTVRDFVPKKVVPPPPYFPINNAPGSSTGTKYKAEGRKYSDNNLTYDDNQPRYDETKTGYEESSVSVDKETDNYEETTSNYEKSTSIYTSSTPSYEESTPADDEDKRKRKETK